MTDEQDKAMEEVRKIMIANFDAYLVTYKSKTENLRTSVGHGWHGDISDVIGLSRIASKRLEALVLSNE